MGYKGKIRDSYLVVGDTVRTKSGLVGEIIGSAEYRTGWEHRIKIPGKAKTMYRREEELELVRNGNKRSLGIHGWEGSLL